MQIERKNMDTGYSRVSDVIIDGWDRPNRSWALGCTYPIDPGAWVRRKNVLRAWGHLCYLPLAICCNLEYLV